MKDKGITFNDKGCTPNTPHYIYGRGDKADAAGGRVNTSGRYKKGFTLAEVLITLTIIGVVAALTIPSLLSNVSDKTYESKRKGLQTRLAQAVAQMDNLTSYIDKDNPVANSSMNFVVEGLSKAYKITNICEFDNFAACDFPASFSRWWDANKYYTKNYRKLTIATGGGNNIMTSVNLGGLLTDAITFKTKNGESVLLWYNPYCVAEQDVLPGGEKMWTKEVCAAMVVDIDGAKKGPNAAGRDIFYGLILYPDTPYLVLINPDYSGPGGSYPSYSTSAAANATAEKACANLTANGHAKGSFTLLTREEEYVIQALYNGTSSSLWTSNVEGSGPDDYGWMVQGPNAILAPRSTMSNGLRCIQKDL